MCLNCLNQHGLTTLSLSRPGVGHHFYESPLGLTPGVKRLRTAPWLSSTLFVILLVCSHWHLSLERGAPGKISFEHGYLGFSFAVSLHYQHSEEWQSKTSTKVPFYPIGLGDGGQGELAATFSKGNIENSWTYRESFFLVEKIPIQLTILWMPGFMIRKYSYILKKKKKKN